MEEIKLLNQAFKTYNLNDDPDISDKILRYILTRLIANKDNFNTMIEMLKVDISFNDILRSFNTAYLENDYYKKNNSYRQGVDYYVGDFPVPIGNIVVETNDVLEVIKYFVSGIKSRNTVTISQTEYYELSLSNMILIIFAEALAKFNISRNLLMIIPYEECNYDDFDELIEIEDEKTNVKQKQFSSKNIIYVENNYFEFEINKEIERLKQKNINYEVINGTLESAIEKIKIEKPKGASIYTKDPSIAYDFITLANSQNVFVNNSLLNSEELNNKTNKLYYKKKIMYPSGQVVDIKDYFKQYENNSNNDKFNLFKKDKLSNDTNKVNESGETALTEIINPWYKRVFEKIKSLFFKKQ